MQLLTEFAPHIIGAAAGLTVLAGIGLAIHKRRSQKRIIADLRYEVADGPIRRSLELRSTYGDTTELIAELRRVADGLQDEIIQSKTGISSQQELGVLSVLSTLLIGVVMSGDEIEIPPTDIDWESNPYLPYSPSPYIPREPSPWDDWDRSKRYITEPNADTDTQTKHEPDTKTETPDAQIESTELTVEQFVFDLRENLCRYHQQLGLGAVMLAYVEPDPEHDFEGGILDVRYDLPSSAVQTHFTRIEKYLLEFSEFANERMASVQSGNMEDIERFKQFLNRACTEFHASLPLINAVVDFQRGAGIDDHIISEFRIFKDLVTNKASAKKTKQQLKDHRRLKIADAALDVSEHLSGGLGCLLGVTSLFYGTLLTMRVKMANDIRAKKQGQ